MPSRLADEREMLALTGALGEAGRGVFMLTKGMTSTIPWLEKIAARQRPPGDDRGDVRRPRRSRARVPRARRDRGGARARPRAVGAGRLLPARHGVHAPPSLPAGGAPRLAARHRGATTRRATARVLADPSFRRAIKREAGEPGRAEPLQRQAVGRTSTSWRCRGPSIAALVGRTIGELARESRAAIRSTASSTSASTASSTRMFDCRLFNTDEDEVRELLRHPARRRRAVRRRRAPVVPLRRGLRPAPLRPLGARARRPHAGAGGAVGDQPRRRRLSHPGSRPPGRRAPGPT